LSEARAVGCITLRVVKMLTSR